MKLASHQPYFFPYIGHFQLISAVDIFIFNDLTQFMRKSWMTRNRILKPKDGWMYIHAQYDYLPVESLTIECRLKKDSSWKEKILAQLLHYKHKARYYAETSSFVRDILLQPENSLANFNINSTIAIAEKIGITTKMYRHSEIKEEVEHANKGNLWGINFCRAMGADTYINAPGGESLYRPEDFIQAGINLGFVQPRLTPYEQKNADFIPGLSIIDVLMFNGFDGTKELIKDYSIKWVVKK